jgi:hypothetical protein
LEFLPSNPAEKFFLVVLNHLKVAFEGGLGTNVQVSIAP